MVLGYYVGNRKSHSLCVHINSSVPANRLVVGLVSAVGFAAVKVGVHARVELVHHVTVVGSSSGVAVSAADGGASVSAVGTSETSASGTGVSAVATCQA
jgi:hypothetical protein